MAIAALNAKINHPFPAGGGFTPTLHDTNDLAESCRSLYVNGAGNVVFNFLDGTGPFTIAVAAGTVLPFAMSRILSTGTTATGLIGLR